MADAVLGVLMQNLNSLVLGEFELIQGVKDDMRKLCSTLQTIRDILEDAEMKQITDKPITNWLKKLKEAAYDADDLVDEWHTKAQKLSESSYTSSLSSFKNIKFRHNIGKKLKQILRTFDEIATERSNFHLNPNVVPNGIQSIETSSIIAEDVVYGRGEEKEEIIKTLLGNVNREQAVSVLTIHGMGGLGKTTLAKLVYNDERVANHFDARIWICVSDDFQVKRLTSIILESLSRESCTLQALDSMQKLLQEQLSNKKFLLVLDDVWTEDKDKWENLKCSLACGTTGSSIIVTTRLETTVSMMGTLPSHSLAVLSGDDCLSLFKGRAFGVGNEEPTELVEIAKQIVLKCRGVPLAAKTLGSMLYQKKQLKDWLHVRDSQIWELPQGSQSGILPALKLSYNSLPLHMRQCFSFCSIFPKDHIIDREELIHLWMANGFVHTDQGNELEDVGNLIFNELLRRCFFQDTWKDEFFQDLMHDLACLVSRGECCTVELGQKTPFPKGVRHLSVVADNSSGLGKLIKSNPRLRTLLFIGRQVLTDPDSGIIFKNLNCLRALDMRSAQPDSVPARIGKMQHLRYLNFSGSGFQSLPESITKLRNLQSLKLRSCFELDSLPKHMRRMTSLRHLDIWECWSLAEMPKGMGQLTQLRTLSRFVLGQGSGVQIKELKGLDYLQGRLQIDGLEHVIKFEEGEDSYLKSKQNLLSLELLWGSAGRDIDSELEEKVMEVGLQPHFNLKVLMIKGYGGAMLPSWMAMVPNLVRIVLDDCITCERLPTLGQLPHLKLLEIDGMESVKRIGEEFYGSGKSPVFTSLEELNLSCMSDLEEWWSYSSSSSKENSRQAFPCLQKLHISSCYKLEAFPFIPCLQELRLETCNEMILRSVGNLTSLQSLRIKDCNALKSLPGDIGNLTALTSLHLIGLRELECLPVIGIQGLNKKSSLVKLEIRDCEHLTSLTEGLRYQTSLQRLKVVSCPEIVFSDGDFQDLTMLQHLEFIGCRNLTQLPASIKHLTSLQSLYIERCENMRRLPESIKHLTTLQKLTVYYCPEIVFSEGDFQDLTMLQHLDIFGCRKLTQLPESIKHLTTLHSLDIWNCENLRRLPESIKHLTTLQTLVIRNCHEDVHRRCEKDKEDWHLISHIPNIYIKGHGIVMEVVQR